ncbi:MAG: HD domain-containing protein [Clostridia bacterium]|nr:HD domain-containing protein [Clostridia bacterium]
MRKISTQNLKAGMKLAKAIYSSRGGLIMPAGIELSSEYVDKLNTAGVGEVYIDDPRVADLEIIEPISEVTKLKAIRCLKESYVLLQKGTGPKVDFESLRQVVKEILEDVNRNNPKVVNLITIKSDEDYLFVHAINVTILAVVMARLAGYQQHLMDIALGAYLKDLGMARLDQQVINAPRTFTGDETAMIRRHPEISLEIIQDMTGLSAFTKAIIIQHHERCDGTGYPTGLKESHIHDYAKIVAIADTFAALISDRPHRARIKPHEAIEFMMSAAGFEFDHNFTDCFCKCTVPYPVGTMVQLNSGEKGVVVDLGKGLASRPVVRVFYDSGGQEVKPCYNLNLSDGQYQTKIITEALEE